MYAALSGNDVGSAGCFQDISWPSARRGQGQGTPSLRRAKTPSKTQPPALEPRLKAPGASALLRR